MSHIQPAPTATASGMSHATALPAPPTKAAGGSHLIPGNGIPEGATTLRIATQQLSDGRDVMTAAIDGSSFSQTHKTDALRRLCRELAAAGYSGPADVCGADGRLRYRVADIAKAGEKTLAETDRGMMLRKWAPFPGQDVAPVDDEDPVALTDIAPGAGWPA